MKTPPSKLLLYIGALVVIISGVIVVNNSVNYLFPITNIQNSFQSQKAQLGGSVTDGLIAHYSFDEGSGSTAKDETGKNSNGILNGDVTWIDGKSGKALQFGGNNSYVNIQTSPTLSGLTEFSLSFWIKPSISGGDSTTQMIFSRGSSYNIRGTLRIFYQPKYKTIGVVFNSKGLSSFNSSELIDPKKWNHVVVSVSTGQANIYIDGVSRSSYSVFGADPLANGDKSSGYTYNMNFGAYQFSSDTPINYFAGEIDEIRIYNRPLNLNEVISLYGLSPSTPPPILSDNVAWPKFFGQVGAFIQSGNFSDFDNFANAGLNLALTYYPSTDATNLTRQSIIKNNIKLVVRAVDELYIVCSKYPNTKCVPTPDEEQRIIDSATAIIKRSASDPNVLGYWILDDPPGEIKGILQKIHDSVVEANITASFPKATICGFGGGLDSKSIVSSNYFDNSGYQNTLGMISLNFSPTACDIIALYPYGIAPVNDPTLIDWSMQYNLPQILSGLRARGWDQSRTPLIAIPGAFSMSANKEGLVYVLPTASDLTTQVESYCKNGAIALITYIWDGKVSLSTTPSLLQGLQRGAEICRTKYWNVPSVPVVETPPPSITVPTPTPTPILRATDGLCGTTLNSCTQGILRNTEDSTTQYLWMCLGSNNGFDASCSQTRYIPPVTTNPPTNPVNQIPTPRVNQSTTRPNTPTIYQTGTTPNKDIYTLTIPTTTIDITLPKLPSWLDIIKALFNKIITNVIRGVKRTGEVVGI